MKKIRTEMFAIAYKGRFLKNELGSYRLYAKKQNAQALCNMTINTEVVKVTVTITPKE